MPEIETLGLKAMELVRVALLEVKVSICESEIFFINFNIL